MDDLRARFGFYSWLSVSPSRGEKCKKWVGSDNIFVAMCSVLDLYNCSRLVSGVDHPAIFQEMVYVMFIYSLFLTKRLPH